MGEIYCNTQLCRQKDPPSSDDDSRGYRSVLLVVVSIDSGDLPILRSEARRGESDSDPSREVVRLLPPFTFLLSNAINDKADDDVGG